MHIWDLSGMEYKWDTPGYLWAHMAKWPVWGTRYPTVSDQPKYGFITNKQNIAREGLRKRTSINHFKKRMY